MVAESRNYDVMGRYKSREKQDALGAYTCASSWIKCEGNRDNHEIREHLSLHTIKTFSRYQCQNI